MKQSAKKPRTLNTRKLSKHTLQCVFVLKLVYASLNLAALDIRVDNLFLVLPEDGSHFSFFEVNEEGRQSLLYNENHRTSTSQIYFDNNIIDLNTNKEFTYSVRQEERSIIARYEFDELVFEHGFTFLAEPDRAVGLQVTYTVRNTSGRTANIGLRNILDTHLGETAPSHFSSEAQAYIDSEYRFNLASPAPSGGQRNVQAVQPYILSANQDLRLFITSPPSSMGTGANPATNAGSQQVHGILANWHRLRDSAWNYLTTRNLGFDNPPFSLNDSAVMFVQNPTTVYSGGSIGYEILLGSIAEMQSVENKQRSIAQARPYLLTDANILTGGLSGRSFTDNFSPEDIRLLRPYIENIQTLDIFISQLDSMLINSPHIDSNTLETLRDLFERLEEEQPIR